MQSSPVRETVDLSGYPDLVVVLLGFRIGSLRTLPALVRIGRGLKTIRHDPPDGLLGDEQCLFGWNHLGIRQYWRNPAALAAFTRSAPHAGWWRDFLRDTKGAGFWHEAYHARGGMEAIYVDMPGRPGLAGFAPIRAPVGPFLSSRDRVAADVAARR
jgi:hypothetical protein